MEVRGIVSYRHLTYLISSHLCNRPVWQVPVYKMEIEFSLLFTKENNNSDSLRTAVGMKLYRVTQMQGIIIVMVQLELSLVLFSLPWLAPPSPTLGGENVSF